MTEPEHVIRFSFSGRLPGKQRPRIAWNAGARTPHTYTPGKTVQAEAALRHEFAFASPTRWVPWDGPVALFVRVHRKPPARWSKARRTAGQQWDMRVPDVDNVLKLICDAMNGVAYKDDRQVVRARIEKVADPERDDLVWVELQFYREGG